MTSLSYGNKFEIIPTSISWTIMRKIGLLKEDIVKHRLNCSK